MQLFAKHKKKRERKLIFIKVYPVPNADFVGYAVKTALREVTGQSVVGEHIWQRNTEWPAV